MLVSTIKEYLRNSSIHGMRYLAEPGRNTFERCLWLVLVVLSWVGTSMLVGNAWNAFQNDAISFAVDTAYLDWDTDFPSVTFCETDNTARIKQLEHTVFSGVNPTQGRVLNQVVFFRTDVGFVQDHCYDPIEKTQPIPGSQCPFDGLLNITERFRTECGGVFSACFWNDVALDCCRYFRPLATEFGTCFSINNRQTSRRNGRYEEYPLISNRSTGPGTLRIEVLVPGEVFWHSNLEVPNRNTIGPTERLVLKMRKHYGVTFRVLPTDNDPRLRSVSLAQRNCRFPAENPLRSFPFYSASACVVECRQRHQVHECNCTTHLMPAGAGLPICDLRGLICVSRASTRLGILKSAWGVGEGIHCPCATSCEDVEIHADLPTMRKGLKGKIIVDVSLAFLPTERFKRNVVRDVLDLVVSMGSTAGLFMGASLLSFVEIAYFFGPRVFGNLRPERSARP